jgi:multidrug resistance efflux pump
MPAVKGRVIEVPVKSNTQLQDGDVSFRINPRPYQYVVDQKKAMLADAERRSNSLRRHDKAQAAVERLRLNSIWRKLSMATSNARRKEGHRRRCSMSRPAMSKLRSELCRVRGCAERSTCLQIRDWWSQHHGRAPASQARRRTVQAASRPSCGRQVRLCDANGVATGHVFAPPSCHGVHPPTMRCAAGFQQNSLQRVRAGDRRRSPSTLCWDG